MPVHDDVESENLNERHQSPAHDLDDDACCAVFQCLLFLPSGSQNEKHSHCSSEDDGGFPQSIESSIVSENRGDHVRHRGFLEAVLNISR